ncbi:hypothetical protein DCS_08275 [Drechmeria coniospora]|uniref:Serine hydrolase domain-containing protein n=1 Tax=Drechmeria coniospora TaxID=98403 RepID=A0A151GGT7_DRECN|nr:hypothetical protein DCS_08275 [Drechmeria coniospora]KYK56305.1 hypothetical protein DCS_08275 [Drechmeria coniospora]ODA80475.1 hypothetical protein RJ55_03433 [Drechmeria coniospora]
MTQHDDTLALPRILCLHGGGVNGTVFRLQCRALVAALSGTFRLVFADAPYDSDAHEAIVGVYGDFGPFYRWLRWRPDHAEVPPAEAADRIVGACRRAMEADGGAGEWAGILGFSQGAKIAVSLLWAQERSDRRPLPARFRFGVVMAGSPPVVALSPSGDEPPPRHVADAAHPSMDFDDWPGDGDGEHAIGTPTLHVHGLLDAGLERHRRLMATYCRPGTTRLVEWQGGHRLPIKTVDVEAIKTEMMALASETGGI